MNPRNRTRRTNTETTTASSAARAAAAATSDDDDASSERKSGCGKGHVFSPLPPLFFFWSCSFFEENFCVFSLDFERET
jgi:hypothetical protein